MNQKNTSMHLVTNVILLKLHSDPGKAAAVENIYQRIQKENLIYQQGNDQVYGHLLDRIETI